MGLGLWFLKNGPGSPGQLTKNVLKSYISIKDRNPYISDEVFIKQTLLLHFKSIVPDYGTNVKLPFKNVGPNYDDKSISFFDELCRIIDGRLLLFVISYVLLYNRGNTTHLVNLKDDVLQVIESVFVKFINSEPNPLINYYFNVELIYSFILDEI